MGLAAARSINGEGRQERVNDDFTLGDRKERGGNRQRHQSVLERGGNGSTPARAVKNDSGAVVHSTEAVLEAEALASGARAEVAVDVELKDEVAGGAGGIEDEALLHGLKLEVVNDLDRSAVDHHAVTHLADVASAVEEELPAREGG